MSLYKIICITLCGQIKEKSRDTTSYILKTYTLDLNLQLIYNIAIYINTTQLVTIDYWFVLLRTKGFLCTLMVVT